MVTFVRALLVLALLPLAPACGKPTEIVVVLSSPDGTAPTITVKLHRMTPFSDNPKDTPPFVVAVLDGPDLDLIVMPQGGETVLSLLPAKGASTDLRVAVSAPPWNVSPPAAVDATFIDGESQEMIFLLTAPPAVDGGGAASDGGGMPSHDGGAMDLGQTG